MKINRQKFDLARARACMGPKEIEAAGFPRGTLSTALNSENVRPETAGRLALGIVDYLETKSGKGGH